MIIEPGLHRELVLPPWERGWGRARREAYIGSRIGSRIGSKVGTAIGTGADPLGGGGGAPDPMAGVTLDASSSKYFPANLTEWTTTITAAGSWTTPDSVWNMQEASGNLADAIGALTLTAAGAPTYQNAISGFTRKGVGMADASSDRFSMASGVGPSPATTSQLWLFVISFPAAAPAAARAFAGANLGSSTNGVRALLLNTSGGIRNNSVGVNADDTTSHLNQTGLVLVQYDRANSNECVYTHLVKIPGTYSASATDGNKGLGSAASGMAAVKALYGALWSGAKAEVASSVIKPVLTRLGWSISWS